MFFVVLVGGLLGLLVVLVIRTLMLKHPSAPIGCNYPPSYSEIMNRQNTFAEILSELIQCVTIVNQSKSSQCTCHPIISNTTASTNEDVKVNTSNQVDNPNEFRKIHQVLQRHFLLVHKFLKKTIINEFSLIFEWKGSDIHLKPTLLCAHFDVVPISDIDKWLQEPFSGKIIDGEIWGRGAIDDKHNVVSVLSAVEYLLEQGFIPKRGIVLAFGHDEEVSGFQGAGKIAEFFKENNFSFECILDEGMFLIEGALSFVPGHVGFIGVIEKGYVDVTLSVEQDGGHSSSPPKQTAIGILAAAVQKLESCKFPIHLEILETSLKTIAFKCSFKVRLFIANLWLFSRFLKRIIISSPSLSAITQTTTAVTVFHGGVKSNVLPQKAFAIVNHRIHPGDKTVEFVIEHDKNTINDPRVKITSNNGLVPSAPSSTHSKGYLAIGKCCQDVFGIPTVPTLMIGNTDTRHYWDFTSNIFRFSPLKLHISEVNMFHGNNERIKVKSLAEMVVFYESFLREMNN